jgi:flagellar biosynthetic protein FliR
MMDGWMVILLPFTLLLGRVGAFMMVLPMFGWSMLPRRLRAGIAVMMSLFFAAVRPPEVDSAALGWMAALLMLTQEILLGIALALAVHLVFLAVKQGGRIIKLTMGLGDAGILDPVTGASDDALGSFFEIAFVLLLLTADVHHLFLMLISRSYDVFPVGAAVDFSSLAAAIVHSGSMMLLTALKVAAPLMAVFLALSVVLAVMARVLPEMNVLMTSFPLRVGVGLLMAAAIVPTLDTFAAGLADWIATLLG